MARLYKRRRVSTNVSVTLDVSSIPPQAVR
ncbi:hypothetical protein NIES4073_81120 [Kalymmatonema gypsitolerans NIES-4073]|nr:hypothetical protein SAMD00079811_09220 [Scytonema sp. HK-05]BAZ27195.1 hypothetical protein NIES4073_81120 [Scytonema sp. NIES-4073]